MPEMKLITCNRCQKTIEDIAYVKIQPAILLQEFFTQTPPLFSCPEHAENYSKGMTFHTDCWMAELKDHGIPIHDMTQVAKKYLEQFNAAKIKEKEGG